MLHSNTLFFNNGQATASIGDSVIYVSEIESLPLTGESINGIITGFSLNENHQQICIVDFPGLPNQEIHPSHLKYGAEYVANIQ
jgi:hypothetical protein